MPELAEVAYYARQWDAGLGKRMARVHVHAKSRVFRGGHAGDLAKALTGTTYRHSFTHGKNMLFEFSGGHWLGGHLGMTGKLLTAAPDYEPQKHDHLVLFTKDAALVYQDYRMFGHWRLEHGSEPPEWWRDLPPEILTRSFTAARLKEFLAKRARTPLK